MTSSVHQGRHPIVAPPTIVDYRQLKSCKMNTFYVKNKEVFNSLVVCQYKFLLEYIERHEAMGINISKDKFQLDLQKDILGTLLAEGRVDEEIGFIAGTYWEHCDDYVESFRGPTVLLADKFYEDKKNLGIHMDFCAYIIRQAFADDFDLKVTNNEEFAKCLAMVKKASRNKNVMKQLEWEDIR